MKYKTIKNKKNIYVLSTCLLVILGVFSCIIFISLGKLHREKTVDIIGGVVSLSKVCEYELGQSWDFDYTGNEQEFIVPCNGTYKIELWGAQGGNISVDDIIYYGGKGGYTKGETTLTKAGTLYIYVAGQGDYTKMPNSFINGGYNGGGNILTGSSSGSYSTSGGGATDIRLVNGVWNNFNSLKSRIMVAAGGGSSDASLTTSGERYVGYGGAGGGLIGITGTTNKSADTSPGTGGKQTSGGIGVTTSLNGGFGYGGQKSNDFATNSGAGGSGYYGGGSGGGYRSGGGGGSSFISGHNGCDAIDENSTSTNIIHTGQPNHYSGYVFTDTVMIDGEGYNWINEKGSYVGQPQPDGSVTAGHSGNGYARITLVQYDLEPPTLSVNNNVVSIDEQGFAINGIKRYDYYITSGSDIPDKNTIPTGTITNSITLDINDDSTIYVRSVDNNNRKGSWSVGYSVLYYNCDFPSGYSWNYDYTGNEQEFVAPCAGTYKIELWGAQGGSEFKIAGGAYTSGEIDFKKGNNVYVYVGKHGGESNSLIFNYGYQNYKNEGGGSTDIRLYNGTWNSLKSLTSRVMVAAGGGNSGGLNSDDGGSPYGGSGGGLVGYQGGNCISKNVTSHPGAIGADQTNGHAFGEVPKLLTSDANSRYNTSGGNGYWSGNFYDWVGVGGHTAVSGSGGGSSFISGHTGCVSVSGVYETTPRRDNANVICTNGTTDPVCSYHFSGLKFTNTKMIDGAGYNWTTSKGAYVGEPEPDGTTSTGHTGNGHAKITLLEPKKDTEETVTINSVTGGSTTWSNNKSFTINATATSGIKQYEYTLKNTYSNLPDFYTIPTGTSTSNVININKTAKYIFFRVETNDGHKSDWYGPVDCYVDEKYIVPYLQNYSYTGYSTVFTPGSLMEINPNNTYVETISARSNNQNARYYFGIIEYDVDLYEIQNRNSAWITGTTTYLTKPLKNGDTVVYLNSTNNFLNSTATYNLGFIVWNYYDSTGYLYPKETYSRHVYQDLFVSSGINRTNNTITLKQPWKNGMIPSGTYLSQSTDGSTYNYGLLNYGALTNSYTTYTNTITSSGMSSNQKTFRYGTKYIKGLVLHNYQNTTSTATLDITNFNITKK